MAVVEIRVTNFHYAAIKAINRHTGSVVAHMYALPAHSWTSACTMVTFRVTDGCRETTTYKHINGTLS